MNCSEFESNLEELVEVRSEMLSDSLATHVRECAACGQRWRDHQLLAAAVRVWRPVVVPQLLAESVLKQLHRDHQPRTASDTRPGTRTGTRWVVVTIAAACLLMLFGFGVSRPTRPTGSGGMAAGRTPESQEVTSSVVAVFQDLKSEYRELAAETSATARDFAIVIPVPSNAAWSDMGLADPTTRPVDTTDSSPDESTGNQRPPGAVTALGRSIGSQISQAMDFLWVAVPDDIPRS